MTGRIPDDEETARYLTELVAGPLYAAADRIAELLREAAADDPDTDQHE